MQVIWWIYVINRVLRLSIETIFSENDPKALPLLTQPLFALIHAKYDGTAAPEDGHLGVRS